MICPNCNQEVRDDALFCPHCGTTLNHQEEKIYVDNPEVVDDTGYHPGQYEETYGSFYNQETMQENPYDRSSFLYSILAFIFPVVGIVLYFFNRKNYPKKAWSALKWALISILVNFITLVFTGI